MSEISTIKETETLLGTAVGRGKQRVNHIRGRGCVDTRLYVMRREPVGVERQHLCRRVGRNGGPQRHVEAVRKVAEALLRVAAEDTRQGVGGALGVATHRTFLVAHPHRDASHAWP